MSNQPSRSATHPIDPQFLTRWSPRAMTGEAVTRDTLMSLFEAARWSPSSGNGQPWRFVYALRDTPQFLTFLDFLVPGNRLWADKAGALIVMVSATLQENNGKPNPTHSFDTGAAWMSLALQGSLLHLVVHGIGGFDREKARQALVIPAEYQVEAMAVIGQPAPAETLPEGLREREIPSQRKPLENLIFDGKWTG
jgi:nitroreductase